MTETDRKQIEEAKKSTLQELVDLLQTSIDFQTAIMLDYEEAETIVAGLRKYLDTLSALEAAALIDDYARRVPRAMLEEIEKQAFEYGKEQFLSYESIDAIAAKYGVKLEGSHEYP